MNLEPCLAIWGVRKDVHVAPLPTNANAEINIWDSDAGKYVPRSLTIGAKGEQRRLRRQQDADRARDMRETGRCRCGDIATPGLTTCGNCGAYNRERNRKRLLSIARIGRARAGRTPGMVGT